MASLSSKARSAVIWNTGFNLFRDLLQFGTMLVLVRMLRPESYGEFALVMSVIGMLSIFSHNNFIAHILQVKDEEDARYQEHFTASAVLQVGAFLLTNLVALALYWAPTYAPASPFLHVMSISFLLEWPYELRRKMLERKFDWARLCLLQGIGLIISAALALLMAWAGAGTYSLVVPGLLVTLPFLYDLFVLEGWRPNWTWSWVHYRPAWNFGLARTAAALAVRARQLMESGFLTAFVGFAALGVFSRSIGLAQMFCQKFSEQMLSAIYPILTRLDGHGADPSRINGLVLRIISWIAVPTAIVFSTLSEPLVYLVYGAQWAEVIALLPWAMAWGALSAVTHATYKLLLAKNQTRMCTHLDVGILVLTGAALLWILPHGLAAYLVAATGIQLLAAIVMFRWLRNLRALSWHGIGSAFVPSLTAGLLAWFASDWLPITLADKDQNSLTSIFVWAATFSAFYLIALRLVFHRQLAELISYAPANKYLKRFLILRASL